MEPSMTNAAHNAAVVSQVINTAVCKHYAGVLWAVHALAVETPHCQWILADEDT
jgi:hypothetical protein